MNYNFDKFQDFGSLKVAIITTAVIEKKLKKGGDLEDLNENEKKHLKVVLEVKSYDKERILREIDEWLRAAAVVAKKLKAEERKQKNY